MERGKFIVFEGMDFSGKTTSLDIFVQQLRDRGIDVVTTREPGGTPMAQALRTILLSPEFNLDIQEQVLLFQTARASNVARVIEPALAAGKWVVSDRYIISSLVYQHDAYATLKATTNALKFVQPDLLIYVTCGLETTLKRKGIRDDNNHLDDRYTNLYTTFAPRYESYVEKLGDMAITIDTNLSPEDVTLELLKVVEDLVGD